MPAVAETTEKMDVAAELARQDFMESVLINGRTALDVAKWVERHYLSAGYTRLCHILRDYAKTK